RCRGTPSAPTRTCRALAPAARAARRPARAVARRPAPGPGTLCRTPSAPARAPPAGARGWPPRAARPAAPGAAGRPATRSAAPRQRPRSAPGSRQPRALPRRSGTAARRDRAPARRDAPAAAPPPCPPRGRRRDTATRRPWGPLHSQGRPLRPPPFAHAPRGTGSWRVLTAIGDGGTFRLGRRPAERLPVLPRHPQARHHVRLALRVLILVDIALVEAKLQLQQLLTDAVLVVQLALRHLAHLVEDEAEPRERRGNRRGQQLEQH